MATVPIFPPLFPLFSNIFGLKSALAPAKTSVNFADCKHKLIRFREFHAKSSMKTFVHVKRFLRVLGILPWHESSSLSTWSPPTTMQRVQNVFFVLLYTQFLCTSLCYLIFVEKDFSGFCLSLFFSASGILDVWIYSVLLLNCEEIHGIIRDTEKAIDESRKHWQKEQDKLFYGFRITANQIIFIYFLKCFSRPRFAQFMQRTMTPCSNGSIVSVAHSIYWESLFIQFPISLNMWLITRIESIWRHTFSLPSRLCESAASLSLLPL